MNRNRLGRSGIVVSDICMGTMTFGTSADEKTAFKIMDKAFDAGIDFLIPQRCIRYLQTLVMLGARKKSLAGG